MGYRYRVKRRDIRILSIIMNPQLNIYKPIGKTSVEMIEILKRRFPEYSGQKISYAGRLDPMAKGVLVLLVGEEENKARREREKSDKGYEFKIVFGISSDTYDILGIPKLHKRIPSIKEVEKIVPKFVGRISQRVPLYSSYRINGSPMYVLAKAGKISTKDQPLLKREIYDLKIIKSKKLSSKELLRIVKQRIGLLSKDFRQEIIIPMYEKLLSKPTTFLELSMSARVSSGTYIRSLCNDIGEGLDTGSIAYDIYRTRSGNHKVEDSLYLL